MQLVTGHLEGAMGDGPEGDPADLGAWLRTATLGRSSSYHDALSSTQDEALRLAAAGAPHGHLVWAGRQTAGRGRLDRRWESPPTTGLWFSVIVRPETAAERMAALPLAVGAAVGAALNVDAPGRVRLKWPNDVLLDGRKMAGILIEGKVSGGVMEHAVAGVGVNLQRPPGGFPAYLEETAAALSDATRQAPARAQVLAAILLAMERGYSGLITEGPAAARREWLELADTIGRQVVARAGGQEVRGRAVDLDAVGNLVVSTAEGPRIIGFGEIEHLR